MLQRSLLLRSSARRSLDRLVLVLELSASCGLQQIVYVLLTARETESSRWFSSPTPHSSLKGQEEVHTTITILHTRETASKTVSSSWLTCWKFVHCFALHSNFSLFVSAECFRVSCFCNPLQRDRSIVFLFPHRHDGDSHGGAPGTAGWGRRAVGMYDRDSSPWGPAMTTTYFYH